MGKGDQRSRKGKITRGSYGKTRLRTRTILKRKGVLISTPLKKQQKTVAVPTAPPPVKVEEKKEVVKEVVEKVEEIKTEPEL